MIDLEINGLPVSVDKGTTVLEAVRFLGFEVPTLCHMDGLSPYGACRLCLVEIGDEPNSKLVTSCTYPATDGLKVRTASRRVVRARKMTIELLVASCPQSKIIQDLAARYGVREVRFKQENEDCILCGLCVRMCKEQMMAGAIGFTYRGADRAITTPFDIKSEQCRLCGGCIYVCPACQLRCTYTEAPGLCGSCANLEAPCLELFPDQMCYLDPCAACELPRAAAQSEEKTKVSQHQG
jgi:coenzyme F420 hydrogenase subunit beta